MKSVRHWLLAVSLLLALILDPLGSRASAATAAQLRERDQKDSAVVDFLTAAPGVTTLDSTDLDFEQTVQAVLDLVEAAR